MIMDILRVTCLVDYGYSSGANILAVSVVSGREGKGHFSAETRRDEWGR